MWENQYKASWSKKQCFQTTLHYKDDQSTKTNKCNDTDNHCRWFLLLLQDVIEGNMVLELVSICVFSQLTHLVHNEDKFYQDAPSNLSVDLN